jgi:hypothetical protein
VGVEAEASKPKFNNHPVTKMLLLRAVCRTSRLLVEQQKRGNTSELGTSSLLLLSTAPLAGEWHRVCLAQGKSKTVKTAFIAALCYFDHHHCRSSSSDLQNSKLDNLILIKLYNYIYKNLSVLVQSAS